MLAASRNPQARSVGNLGDILKHAALFELASMLAETSPAVRWVETHTFLLHAPLADATRWSREIDELVATRPAYARYAAHQREALARTDRYRCSSGLVLDALGERRGAATLGEANGITRVELREQIRDERLANVMVVDDALAAIRDAAAHDASSNGGAVLVHVDPFTLTPDVWSSLAAQLDELCASASEVVVVAYRYTRQARSAWPAPPRGTIGPVGETRGGPHEVAAYASPGMADPVRAICAGLGW